LQNEKKKKKEEERRKNLCSKGFGLNGSPPSLELLCGPLCMYSPKEKVNRSKNKLADNNVLEYSLFCTLFCTVLPGICLRRIIPVRSGRECKLVAYVPQSSPVL
jgi:hypothetical protein